MKHIYVSPHADDVALSCGGQIIANPARTKDVLVLNIFSSDASASESQHTAGRLFDSLNSERTSEDRAAWDHAGVQTASADLPEALLRRKFPFPMSGRIDDEILPAVREIVVDCIRSYPDARFHFSGGFGGHIDHLVCRQAGLNLLDEGRLDSIILYEDTPYSWLRFIRTQSYKAMRRSAEFDAASREITSRADGVDLLEYLSSKSVPFPRGKLLFLSLQISLAWNNLLHSRGRRPVPYQAAMRLARLDRDLRARKLELLRHYQSQLPMLFGPDPDSILARLGDSFEKEVSIELRKNSPSPRSEI